MRKRVLLLLAAVLAFALSLCVASACTKKVSVTLNKTEITVETGRTQTITATTSTGCEVEWASSDETVATVTNGKIKGEKAGTAIITATAVAGKGSAQCQVTVKDPVEFTFMDESGRIIDEVKVDRNGEPVRISVFTSDGSKVTSWFSDDTKIATVENGLITGLYDGDTVITARTSTGTGKINVNVYDTFTGEKYDISDITSAKRWHYWVEHPNETEILANEYRGGVTFGFSGGNWSKDSVRLIYKGGPGWADWEKWWDDWFYFQAKIEADFDATINISGTRVHLHEGENQVKIKLPLGPGANSCLIEFGTAKDGTLESGTIIITDMVWYQDIWHHGTTPLDTPSYTIDGQNITITDKNEEGVEEYKLGLFVNEDDKKPAFIQILSSKNETIDTSKFAKNGDYYVKVMAVGNPGYLDTEWSAASEDKYTVHNETIEYDVPEGGASDAMSNAGWHYFIVDGGSVMQVTYDNGSLTLKSGYLGWAFYSTELLCHYPEYEKGEELLISMKVNASHPGTVTISDTVLELEAGDNQIYVKRVQKEDATIVIMFGKWADGTENRGVVDFPLDTELTFVFSDITLTQYSAVNLETVSGTVDSENKTITVDDPNEAGVKSYELGFFKGNTLMKLIPLVKNEDVYSFNDETLNDGEYTLKIRAIATDVRYVAADWSAVTETYEVNNGGATYKVIFGGDADYNTPTGNALKNQNTWYYWNDQNWSGSDVEVKNAEVVKGKLSVTYTINSGYNADGIRFYYKDPSITGDRELTAKIETDEDIDVILNDAKLSLKKGENNVTVYYTQDGGTYSFVMLIAVDSSKFTENTIVISELNYEPYTYKILEAPQLSLDKDGVVTITDSNLDTLVKGYELGYFTTEGATTPLATISIKSGEKIDYSMLDSGDYVLKIKAIAEDNTGYKASGWSAGVDYNVVNEEGAHYDLATDFGWETALKVPGRWGLWADKYGWIGAWVNIEEATFANDEVNITFSSGGKAFNGIQINYVTPDYVEGTEYSFDIVASEDMDIRVENNESDPIRLKAGEKVTLTGGTDASFYIAVNIDNSIGGTITISNVQWNEKTEK